MNNQVSRRSLLTCAAGLAATSALPRSGHADWRPTEAVRIIVPPYMGNAISHCKNSSLASVITVPELMLTAQMIYSSTYRAIEILSVTGLIYLALTSCLSALQMYLERVTAYEQRGLGEGRRRRLRLDAPLPTMPAS